MAIKLFNTKAFGQVVADVEESLTTGAIKLIKPAFVQLHQNPENGQIGVAQMAIMKQFVSADYDYIFLNADDVIGGDLNGHVPSDAVYNDYQERFGSGFTLHTSPIIK